MRTVKIFAAVDQDRRNFGDNLMEPILQALFNMNARLVAPDQAELIGVGSIIDAVHRRKRRSPFSSKLQNFVDIARGKRPFLRTSKELHVWGSGFLDPDSSAVWPQKLIFHSVRGPLTRARINQPLLPLGDPGLLLPLMWPKPATSTAMVTIVPHYTTHSAFLAKLRSSLPKHWRVVDVLGSPADIARAIASSEFVISSSLHGIITADAYGVPSCSMAPDTQIRGGRFKFQDYAAFRGRGLYGPVKFETFLNEHNRIVVLDECRPGRPDDKTLSAILAAFPFN